MQTAINRASEEIRDGNRQKERACIIRAWWAELTEQPKGKDDDEHTPPRVNRRGERAELRRCSSVADVALCEAYLRLRAQLAARKLWESDVDGELSWLAAVAGVLAHVDDDAPRRGVGAVLGAPKNDKATVSRLRFQRLLASTEADEVYRQMRGLVRLTDRTTDVWALAHDLSAFAGPRADEIRSGWAFDYFKASPESGSQSKGK